MIEGLPLFFGTEITGDDLPCFGSPSVALRSKMPEMTIWINPGQEANYCPKCHSFNIRLAENGRYGSCNECDQNFNICYKKSPKNRIKRHGVTPEEVRAFVKRQAEEFGCQ